MATPPNTDSSRQDGTPPPQRPTLEIPLFNHPSLLPAIAAGARRIELNAPGSYAAGGTTPSLALARTISADLDGLPFSVPLRVMVRPREGDFHYSDRERAQIRTSIAELKGVLNQKRGDGFVFGALLRSTSEGEGGGGGWSIDTDLCESVLAWAEPFPVVFHRAFDEAVGSDGGPGVEEKLELVQGLGFEGLLTSGGVGNAWDNLAVVRRIVARAGGLEVVVGGGVRGRNLGAIYEELRMVEGARVVYHSSCLRDPGSSEEVDVDEVRRIVRVLGAGDQEGPR